MPNAASTLSDKVHAGRQARGRANRIEPGNDPRQPEGTAPSETGDGTRHLVRDRVTGRKSRGDGRVEQRPWPPASTGPDGDDAQQHNGEAREQLPFGRAVDRQQPSPQSIAAGRREVRFQIGAVHQPIAIPAREAGVAADGEIGDRDRQQHHGDERGRPTENTDRACALAAHFRSRDLIQRDDAHQDGEVST